MAKRSDRGLAKLAQNWDRPQGKSESEMSTNLANDHQGPQRTPSELHQQAGYKTAMNPPSQTFKDQLATREASI